MTDHMQTPDLPEEKPVQGCPFGHGQVATPGAPIGPAPSGEGWHDAQLDFSESMSYGDYLSLGTVLDAQRPLSPDHNEMLFIIEQLVQAWSVLATMTPSEYTAMRPYLGSSSGFQSYQYRQIEFLLGNKNEQMLKPHAHRTDIFAEVTASLEAPSFYDEVVRLLSRRGFAIAPSRLERDWTQPTTHDASVEAAWLEVYRNPSQHWELYEMAEELVDLEDAFRQWRFRHVTPVERVIGFKQGTGGTAGAPYLRKMLDVVLFPELWHVRTLL